MKRRVLQITVLLLLGAIVNVAVAWGCAAYSPMIDTVGATESYRVSSSDGPSHIHVQTGLPLRSLSCKANSQDEDLDPRWLLETKLAYLPLRPLWPGFAINTNFYAAVLWMIFFAPFALRRRLRIRRGLCPACAYPIGSSLVCTECGVTLPLSREGESRGEGA